MPAIRSKDEKTLYDDLSLGIPGHFHRDAGRIQHSEGIESAYDTDRLLEPKPSRQKLASRLGADYAHNRIN